MRSMFNVTGSSVATALLAFASAVAAGPLAPSGVFGPRTPSDFDPAAQGLRPVPIVSEELGLAMHPPAGAVHVPQRVEGGLVLSVLDGEQPPSWSISIQHVIALTPDVSAASQVHDHLAALRRSDRPHRIIANDAVELADARGQLCYIEQVTSSGERYVTGWLILPLGEELFLVFSLVASADEFPTLRSQLEASFATINLRSEGEVIDRRLSRIEAGREFLSGVKPEQLRGLVGLNQFSRIYRENPSGDGEVEIGFSQLEVYEGKRGQVNPDRPESSYTLKEQTPGIVVRISGMVIGDLERNLFFDSLAIYWMDWDQSEETWTVVGTQRQGRAQRSEVETGVRTAPSPEARRPMLRTIRDNSATQLRDVNEWELPSVYLSQALAPLLGRLLPMTAGDEREFAWYFYNFAQAAPSITQRVDRWTPADDGSGNWILTSRLSVDTAPVRSIYAPDRTLVRTIRPDGMITEPTTPENLARIWQRKGLPIERTPVRR